MYIHACILYANIYVYTYIYMYMYIYIYTHTHTYIYKLIRPSQTSKPKKFNLLSLNINKFLKVY